MSDRFHSTGITSTPAADSEEFRVGHTTVDFFSPSDPDRAAHALISAHDTTIVRVSEYISTDGETTSIGIVARDGNGVHLTFNMFGSTKADLLAALQEA